MSMTVYISLHPSRCGTPSRCGQPRAGLSSLTRQVTFTRHQLRPVREKVWLEWHPRHISRFLVLEPQLRHATRIVNIPGHLIALLVEQGAKLRLTLNIREL